MSLLSLEVCKLRLTMSRLGVPLQSVTRNTQRVSKLRKIFTDQAEPLLLADK